MLLRSVKVGRRALMTSRAARAVVPFHLGDIGEGISEVEILRWFVKEGQMVEEMEPVCEVQSDKANTEITSRFTGRIVKLHYDVGELAQTGEPLLDIDTEDDDAASAAAAATAAAAVGAGATLTGAATPASATTTAPPPTVDDSPAFGRPVVHVSGRVLATPAVRHIARQHNVDLAQVPGSGRDGRVMKHDVLAFLEGGDAAPSPTDVGPTPVAPPPASAVLTRPAVAEDTVVPLRGFDRAMVKTMTAAASVPLFLYCDEIEMDALARLRSSLKPDAERRGVKLTFMPLLIKAVSLALRDFPRINATVSADVSSIVLRGQHNIGVAMATDNGLVVPNIKDVQAKSVLEIAAEMSLLMDQARQNKLPQSCLTGGTFTLSNIGAVGGTYAKPVVLVPEVAIGAFGKFQTLPRFDAEGAVVARTIMNASWSADHRVIDGATIAGFSNAFKRYVEDPATMVGSMV